MTIQVSLTTEPELLIESEQTISILNFSLSEPPPAEGIVITVNTSDLFDFNLSQTQVEGGEITLESELIQQLETNLDATRAPEVPGAAVAVVSPFGTWFGASGVANLEDNTLLQPSDRFEIGSITKTFTATTVLQLVEENVLALDDTLTNWLPEEVTANIPNADEITLQQLLQHTSGVADYVDLLFAQAVTNPLIFAQDWQPEQLVNLIDGIEPFFEPEESFTYSNTNFLLAGMVIEAATDNNIAAEIRTRIIDPLGLENTFFAEEEEIPGGYVSGYWDFDSDGILNDTTFTNLSWTWSTGAMVSNTEDLDTFARNLFAGDLLKPDTLAMMLDTIPAIDNNNYSSYGLGVGTIESPNRFWYIHRGLTLGYRSNLWYSPQDDLTYIELINGFSRDNLVRDILPTFREGINDGVFELTITGQEAQISIPILNDGVTEGEETVTFTLGEGEGYQVNPDAASGEFIIFDTSDESTEPSFIESIFGTLNDDVIEVEGNNQLLFTGDADDLIDASISSEGGNRIYAGSGNDTLILGTGDRAIGGAGDDRFLMQSLMGETPKTALHRFFATSGGDNTLTGGVGADQFWIAVAEIPEAVNIITDFTISEDVLGIAGLGIGFSDLSITDTDKGTLIASSNNDLALITNVSADLIASEDNFAFA